MLENYKLRSADGLSLYLLYFWLAGKGDYIRECCTYKAHLYGELPMLTFISNSR